MRNPCKGCDYYHKENNTCQSKKCCTGGDGYITWIDRLFCKPYKYNADRKTESNSEKPNNCENEPQYEMGMGTLKCDNCSEYGSFKCTKCDGEMYFTRLEPKDEPQTKKE